MTESDGNDRLTWETSLIFKITETRKAQGLTQTDLAKRLADLGLPFHQQTIQRIEAGERPIRLNEAIALCQVLGLDLLEAVFPETTHHRQAAIAALYRPAVEVYGKLQLATRELILLRDRFGSLAQAVEQAGGTVDPAMAVIGELTPVAAIQGVAAAADLADSETAQMTLHQIGAKCHGEHPEAS